MSSLTRNDTYIRNTEYTDAQTVGSNTSLALPCAWAYSECSPSGRRLYPARDVTLPAAIAAAGLLQRCAVPVGEKRRPAGIHRWCVGGGIQPCKTKAAAGPWIIWIGGGRKMEMHLGGCRPVVQTGQCTLEAATFSS